MDATSEGSANQQRPLPASSSPLSSPGCSSTQTWLPVDPWMNNCRTEEDHAGMSSQPRFYEELFCTSRTLNALVPLAGALMTSSAGPQSDVIKQGYLGKLERNHRRYFVLRGGSHTGPSRLEWYKSQEKFAAAEKCAGKAALFGSSKQGVIYLRCCLGVSRVASSRKGHTVALYAKDQTLVLVVEDQREQEEWYLAIKKLMEEERKDEEHGEGFEEEDDGYCTLPPAAFFKEVWPVTVKPTGLGCSKSLAGESRLCLTASSLILIRLGACSDLPSVTIPLLSVRRFGHLDGSFFVELGRSAPNGPGEIWMEAREQGNQAAAQHIHEVIRETVKALRVLPDFSRSPTSNHNQLQSLLSLKRCRPKYRDRAVTVRPLGSRLYQPPKASESQTSPTKSYQELRKLDKAEPEPSLSSTTPLRAHQSSVAGSGSYMEMKTDHHPTVNELRDSCSGMEGWEPGGEEEEGLGYMMMSPQPGSSSSLLPQDDYVTMASPHKHNLPAYASLQTSFSSSISDSYSPVRRPHHQLSQPNSPVTSLQPSETEAGQLQRSISCSARPQDEARQEQRSAQRGHLPARTRVTSSPVRSVDESGMIASSPVRSVDESGMIAPVPQSGYTRPFQASPNRVNGRLQSVSNRSSRGSWLSLCLPSCLHAEDRS